MNFSFSIKHYISDARDSFGVLTEMKSESKLATFVAENKEDVEFFYQLFRDNLMEFSSQYSWSMQIWPNCGSTKYLSGSKDGRKIPTLEELISILEEYQLYEIRSKSLLDACMGALKSALEKEQNTFIVHCDPPVNHEVMELTQRYFEDQYCYFRMNPLSFDKDGLITSIIVSLGQGFSERIDWEEDDDDR
jgi:hypothetical protein